MPCSSAMSSAAVAASALGFLPVQLSTGKESSWAILERLFSVTCARWHDSVGRTNSASVPLWISVLDLLSVHRRRIGDARSPNRWRESRRGARIAAISTSVWYGWGGDIERPSCASTALMAACAGSAAAALLAFAPAGAGVCCSCGPGPLAYVALMIGVTNLERESAAHDARVVVVAFDCAARGPPRAFTTCS